MLSRQQSPMLDRRYHNKESLTSPYQTTSSREITFITEIINKAEAQIPQH